MVSRLTPLALAGFLSFASWLVAAPPAELPGDRMLRRYFAEETGRVHAQSLGDITTLADWTGRREQFREELREMLGLSPYPEKTDLKATITGREEQAEFFVEKLHYQSMPGLYVTGNLYVPKNLTRKAPAILYVCGHANVKQNGISYGAKANYQHHGEWFARHGYVCLTIDTIQNGELEGLHHGIYREGMWWWNSRGYTPGGVEAWNSVRALDYLQSRPEVDAEKLGITGRSGGGIYSWYTAALDDRVKVAVPVSGITDLHNYVVDGCVTGHCDCMFVVNTYRWDYAKLAAMVAPRPLLIGNSDKDPIFPLDGVVRLHAEVARIYKLHQASDKLGLLITEGPHKDTQDLQVPTFRWFDRFLKGEQPLITTAAEKLLRPEQLRVFATLPADQRTTKIHDTFVPAAAPEVPANAEGWAKQRTAWLAALREKSFRGWPRESAAVAPTQVAREMRGGLTLTKWEFTSQSAVQLPLFVFSRGDPGQAKAVRLHVLDEGAWAELASMLGGDASAPRVAPNGTAPALAGARALLEQAERGEIVLALLPPRGIGPTQWGGDAKARVHMLRRFQLLGQTLEGMRVWDIRRAVEALRDPAVLGTSAPVSLSGERRQAVNALYASLFSEGIAGLELVAPPVSHQTGPDYLNVLRFLDVPQAVALAAERAPVRITRGNPDDWGWASNTARRLGWPADRLQW